MLKLRLILALLLLSVLAFGCNTDYTNVTGNQQPTANTGGTSSGDGCKDGMPVLNCSAEWEVDFQNSSGKTLALKAKVDWVSGAMFAYPQNTTFKTNPDGTVIHHWQMCPEDWGDQGPCPGSTGVKIVHQDAPGGDALSRCKVKGFKGYVSICKQFLHRYHTF